MSTTNDNPTFPVLVIGTLAIGGAALALYFWLIKKAASEQDLDRVETMEELIKAESRTERKSEGKKGKKGKKKHKHVTKPVAVPTHAVPVPTVSDKTEEQEQEEEEILAPEEDNIEDLLHLSRLAKPKQGHKKPTEPPVLPRKAKRKPVKVMREELAENHRDTNVNEQSVDSVTDEHIASVVHFADATVEIGIPSQEALLEGDLEPIALVIDETADLAAIPVSVLKKEGEQDHPRVTEFQKELASVRNQVAESASIIQNLESLLSQKSHLFQEMQSESQRLAAENERLISEISDVRAVQQTVEDLQTQMVILRDTNRVLTQSLVANQLNAKESQDRATKLKEEAVHNEYRQTIHELETRNQQLLTQLTEKDQLNEATRREAAEARHRLAQLDDKFHRVQKDLAAERERFADQLAESHTLRQAAQEAKVNGSQLEAKLQESELVFKNTRHELESVLRKVEGELEVARDEIDDLRKELDGTRSTMGRLRKEMVDIQTLQEELESLKMEKRRVEEELESQRTLTHRSNQELANLKSSLTGEELLHEEIERLRTQVEEGAKMRAAIEVEVKEHQNEVVRLTKSRADVQSELEAARSESGKLKQELDALIGEKASLLTESSAIRETEVAARTEAETMRKQIEDLERLESSLRTARDEALSRVDTLEKEMEQVRTLSSDKKEITILKAAKVDAEAQIAALAKQLQESTEAQHAVEQQLEETQTRLWGLDELCKSTMGRLKDSLQTTHATRDENDRMKSELDVTRKELERLHSLVQERDEVIQTLRPHSEKKEMLRTVASDDTLVETSTSEAESAHSDKPNTTPYEFTWGHGGKDVIVTGTFDNWSQSVHLTPSPTHPSLFSATVPLVTGERVLYKFVVDGEWKTDPDRVCEVHEGIVNNVAVAGPTIKKKKKKGKKKGRQGAVAVAVC
ncbi:uncharacterized protein SPPG_00328 [Spizellomyces punctatus DAOM BR117]|uniref:AMP-activated protein kinase glycogen-binding domain-containing protein n=1 Tax=Spizellomyces punctatus (strain DAOM BR117) TaxID=645134 RepID=A0A0L0HUP6_SPIPD|nr:uncharacterized protein SPPG_00328 [Spizellomyces punctatus DAOM BR117]KND04610.1 hypothetical protein SPPG_00328 [Spizellomyces punctatus DAOM BR117]|eukprot:XP_016612649.1 hypothetical protein SPPG_00328 [Spizellomyces punctatus DAOM BR117]